MGRVDGSVRRDNEIADGNRIGADERDRDAPQGAPM
jgi:hypothetical protein